MSAELQTTPLHTTTPWELAMAMRTQMKLLNKMVPTTQLVIIMQQVLHVHIQVAQKVIGIYPLRQS
jgi:hypothetical protein